MKIPGLENPATPEEVQRILHNPAFEKYMIGTIGSWRLYVHPRDQRFLGRCYAWWMGKKHVDLMDPSCLSDDEVKDLWLNVTRRYRAAVHNLWGATHVNYAWLGNETRIHRGHGHLHMIPRYFGEAPHFCGLNFADPRVGEDYRPSEPFTPSDDILSRIRDSLRKELGLA